jgi:hypothetical protein
MLSFCQQPTSGKKWPPFGPAVFSQSSSHLLPSIAHLVPRVQILADIPELFIFPESVQRENGKVFHLDHNP